MKRLRRHGAMLRQAAMALATALLLTGFAGTTPVLAGEEAPSEPPVLVAKDDRFTMYGGAGTDRLEVYLNDPALDQYDVAAADERLDRPAGVSKKEVRVQAGAIVVRLDPKRTKDVVFRYRLWQNETGALSNWATVTITVIKNIPLKFRALGDGKLKVINKNAARADCVWWKAGDWRSIGQGPVKGNGSRILRLKVPAIDITCTLTKYTAITADRRVKVRL